jgi:twitching motility protein PilI
MSLMVERAQHVLTSTDAMALLADIEQRCRLVAQRLPETDAAQDVWDGLVFSIAGVRVVAAMNEVSEMLPNQDRVTRVPGSRPWMIGLANVRGSLLPVIDLQAYLGGKTVVASKAARILVLRLRGLVAGLLVPSVQGMRHFNLSDRLPDARMKGALGAYVYEAFSVDGAIWPVFSMSALAADPEFRTASA